MICAEMGLDPLAVGGTVATAMEMEEKGILSKESLRMELKFGQGENLLRHGFSYDVL